MTPIGHILSPDFDLPAFYIFEYSGLLLFINLSIFGYLLENLLLDELSKFTKDQSWSSVFAYDSPP